MAKKINPPGFSSSRGSGPDEDGSDSNSSRSVTPENNGKVEFITSFGGESEDEKKVVTMEKSGISNEQKNRLKRLRRGVEDEEAIPSVVMGPTLPMSSLDETSRRRSNSPDARHHKRRSVYLCIFRNKLTNLTSISKETSHPVRRHCLLQC